MSSTTIVESGGWFHTWKLPGQIEHFEFVVSEAFPKNSQMCLLIEHKFLWVKDDQNCNDKDK